MEPGDTLKLEFRIVKSIGKGGMGEVWQANSCGGFGHVAVKRILPIHKDDKELIKRFKREVRILKQLHHENIVQILFADLESVLPYYVMEYIDRESMANVMNGYGFNDVIRVFADVCRGVAFAHKRGVLHRDLKPANILITNDGQARVSDFGLGVFVPRDTTAITGTGDGAGTPPYMPKEQFGDLKNVSFTADIYSLSVILLQLLTKELPVGKTQEYMTTRITEVLPEVSEQAARRMISEAVRSLNDDPNKRHPSVEEFLNSILAASKVV